MNKADQVKASMNLRQRYRCKRAERHAYGCSMYSFRDWMNLGQPCCVVHESWQPGQDFLPRWQAWRGGRPEFYPRRVHNDVW